MAYYFTNPHFARRWAAQNAAEAVRPLPVSIREENEDFILTAFVPGLKAEDLNIKIVEETLSIEGTFGNQEGDYLVSELPAGAFSRTLHMPAELDAEKAEASISNGILTLRIPRSEAARPKIIQVAVK